MSAYYSNLAGLLEYPTSHVGINLSEFQNQAKEFSALEAECAKTFCDWFSKLNPQQKEELYVATFDVNAVCCLDTGYAVFGEDYKRGQLMAELKIMHREFNNECGAEMPDFLPNILRLLTKIPYGDSVELAQHIVVPAVAKMRTAFADNANPYNALLFLVESALRRDFDYCEEEACSM